MGQDPTANGDTTNGPTNKEKQRSIRYQQLLMKMLQNYKCERKHFRILMEVPLKTVNLTVMI